MKGSKLVEMLQCEFSFHPTHLSHRISYTETSRAFSTPKKAKLLPFDHVFPEPGSTLFTPLRTAILYADVTSPNFRDLHEYLMASAMKLPPKIQYVFRHVPPPKLTEGLPKREYLSGYGVGLDLKKMDYLALDDRRTSAGENTGNYFNAVRC